MWTGLATGLLLAVKQFWTPSGGWIGHWLATNKGWEITTFAAFGAMSGFTLAAVALVATLSAHPRGQEIIDANPGRFLLRMLVKATWLWMAPGVLALLHVALPYTVTRALFLWTVCVGLAQGAIALLALTLFFKRFTIPRP